MKTNNETRALVHSFRSLVRTKSYNNKWYGRKYQMNAAVKKIDGEQWKPKLLIFFSFDRELIALSIHQMSVELWSIQWNALE